MKVEDSLQHNNPIKRPPEIDDILSDRKAGELGAWDKPEIVPAYERFSQAYWYRAVIRDLIDLLPLKPSSTLIDIGCGTGVGTFLLSQRVDRNSQILGVDPSNIQIDFAQRSASSKPNIQFHPLSASEAAIRYRDAFDGVISFNSIHLLGPLQIALKELSAMMKPGGFVALCTAYHTHSTNSEQAYRAAEFVEAIMRIGRNFYGELLDRTQPGHGLAYHSINMDELSYLLSRAGLVTQSSKLVEVSIPDSSLVDFMALPGMIDSFLPEGLSRFEIEALVRHALLETEITTLSRKWLYVVASRL
jgi:ubiquinone/menaquinone biosynthesis C-methylase UbiE